MSNTRGKCCWLSKDLGLKAPFRFKNGALPRWPRRGVGRRKLVSWSHPDHDLMLCGLRSAERLNNWWCAVCVKEACVETGVGGHASVGVLCPWTSVFVQDGCTCRQSRRRGWLCGLRELWVCGGSGWLCPGAILCTAACAHAISVLGWCVRHRSSALSSWMSHSSGSGGAGHLGHLTARAVMTTFIGPAVTQEPEPSRNCCQRPGMRKSQRFLWVFISRGREWPLPLRLGLAAGSLSFSPEASFTFLPSCFHFQTPSSKHRGRCICHGGTCVRVSGTS